MKAIILLLETNLEKVDRLMIDDDRCKGIFPPNIGWLEYNLTQQELDYIWSCVNHQEVKKNNWKKHLAGNINSSFLLQDKDDWFYNNTLINLIGIYGNQYYNLGKEHPVTKQYTYFLKEWWVNYQYQHEFNPQHKHDGIYSFVIWLKIPTRFEEQKKLPIANVSNSNSISNFTFTYCNILGNISSYSYQMNPELEGKLLFFPSKLVHQVYPYFNCDKERISISGNIWIDDR